jgi:ribulose-5-phosphate 4-epimerase/fuculose-1-phosphate aldolase
LITIGENLREAADATLAVEHTIKILVTCKLVGKEPTDILADAMKFLIDYEGGA